MKKVVIMIENRNDQDLFKALAGVAKNYSKTHFGSTKFDSMNYICYKGGYFYATDGRQALRVSAPVNTSEEVQDLEDNSLFEFKGDCLVYIKTDRYPEVDRVITPPEKRAKCYALDFDHKPYVKSNEAFLSLFAAYYGRILDPGLIKCVKPIFKTFDFISLTDSETAPVIFSSESGVIEYVIMPINFKGLEEQQILTVKKGA